MAGYTVPAHEADLSTQEALPPQRPRLPQAHVDARRGADHQGAPPEGAEAARAHRPEADPVERKLRLRLRQDFSRVYAARRGRAGRYLVLHARPNDLGHPRVGFSVSSKVGGAVRRNLVKRRLRAAVAEIVGGRELSLDLVVVARPPCVTAAFADLRAELAGLLDEVST